MALVGMNFNYYYSSFRFYFSLLFCCGFILFFPFPYYTFPEVGTYFEPTIRPLVHWTGVHLLNIHEPFTSELMSDSSGLYVFVFLLAIFSLIGAIVLSSIIKPELKSKIAFWFYTFLAYYLALTLLKYGADKIFKHQFYLPEPNTLFTPIGQTTPDLLYWTSMGSSYSYSVFSGIIEIIPALFLLFRKTRLLGILISIAILCNVVMINFGFDITVKVYSLFLLFIAIVLVSQHLKPLYQFFILKEKTSQSESDFQLDSTKKLLVYTITKTLFFGLILFETFGIYFATNNLNDDKADRPLLYGAYEVFHYVEDGQIYPATITFPNRIRRIFFHRREYLILQTMDDRFIDYKYSFDKYNEWITLSSAHTLSGESKTSRLNYTIYKDELSLRGYFNGKGITCYSKKIDISQLPLLREKMHWTIESFVE